MSESEDNQSIISHHCAAMILVVDTEDGSLLKPSECKAFLSQSVARRYIFKYVIQKRLKKKEKKKKHSPKIPTMFSAVSSIIVHNNIIYFISKVSVLQFICRGTILVE